MIVVTMLIYAEKYRNFGSGLPSSTKNDFMSKCPLGNWKRQKVVPGDAPSLITGCMSCMPCSASANYSQKAAARYLLSPWGGNWCCCWSAENTTQLKPITTNRNYLCKFGACRTWCTHRHMQQMHKVGFALRVTIHHLQYLINFLVGLDKTIHAVANKLSEDNKYTYMYTKT